MSLVLPYHEDLAISGGGFIHPNGSIIHAFGKHEVIAKNYCEGEIDCVEDPKSGLSIDYQALLSFKKSQLTPEQYQNYLLSCFSHYKPFSK